MARKSIEDANHGSRRPKRKASHGIADYAAMDGAKVVKLIEQLTNWGCAIRFGKTRDGGAYALGIYGVDDIPYTEFLPPSENPVEYLEELVDWLEGDPSAQRGGR